MVLESLRALWVTPSMDIDSNVPNGPPPIFGLLVGLAQWTAKTLFSGLVQVLNGLPFVGNIDGRMKD